MGMAEAIYWPRGSTQDPTMSEEIQVWEEAGIENYRKSGRGDKDYILLNSNIIGT